MLCFSWHSEQNIQLILPFLEYLRDEGDVDVHVLTSDAAGKVRLLRSGFPAYNLNEVIRASVPDAGPAPSRSVLLDLTLQDRLIDWKWTPEDPPQPQTPSRDTSESYAIWKAEQVVRAYRWLLRQLSPAVVYTWNGSMVVQNALAHCATERGIPSYFLERGLLPDSLVVDPAGVNCRSALAGTQALSDWLPLPSPVELQQLSAYCQALHDNATTIVKTGTRATQAEARRRLGLRPESRVVMLPLQIEHDSNIVLHSPHYKKMADIIHDAGAAAEANGDVCIVVRPHPEDSGRRDALDALASPHVVLSWDLDLHSLLDISDAVVTVNSTVGLESLLQGKPVVALGNSIYSGKGFTHDVAGPADFAPALRAALASERRHTPRQDVLHFLAILLNRLAFSYDKADPWLNRTNLAAMVRRVASSPRPAAAIDGAWYDLERTNTVLRSVMHALTVVDGSDGSCLLFGALEGLLPAGAVVPDGRLHTLDSSSGHRAVLDALSRRYDVAICPEYPRSLARRLVWDQLMAGEKLVLG